MWRNISWKVLFRKPYPRYFTKFEAAWNPPGHTCLACACYRMRLLVRSYSSCASRTSTYLVGTSSTIYDLLAPKETLAIQTRNKYYW